LLIFVYSYFLKGAVDPTEAIRSDEIIGVLQQYFEIIEKKEWGGNVLQYMLAGISGNFTPEDESLRDRLRMLTNIEETLIKYGELKSDFAYIVARARSEVI
jgi:hypothetical protein